MSSREKLDRQIQTWLEKQKNSMVMLSPPSAKIPELPDLDLTEIHVVPKLTASIQRLEISSILGLSVPVLASLVSVMHRNEAEKLYGELSHLNVTCDIDERLAENWFTACHKLPKENMAYAVSGFFRLVELHRSNDFNIDQRDFLACWFRLLMAPVKQDQLKTDISLKVAEQYPDWFAYVCIRIASGGAGVLSAVEIFFEKTENSHLNRSERVNLLDFTLEAGWLLSQENLHQLWKLISRRGSIVQSKLRDIHAPVGSFRFLAGLLRGIEEIIGFDKLLSMERVHKAMTIFDSSSKSDIQKSFSLYPDLGPCIDSFLEADLAIESVSHGISGTDLSEVGYFIVAFLDSISGGVSLPGIIRLLKVTGKEISAEAVEFLMGVVDAIERESRLSPSNIIYFSSIVFRVIPISTATDRASLKAFHRALTKMDNSLARWALLQMDNAILHSDLPVGCILAASSILIRSSNEENKKQYLTRIVSTGRLLAVLSPVYRTKVLTSLAPLWVEAIMSFNPEVEKAVTEYVSQIVNIAKRDRFLENIVARLLQEVHPNDPVFRECLAFAVSGYNSSEAIEKLRETERLVLKKVIRAGGRIEAVDLVMKDLLSIPGFEGDKTEQLISGIQTICDRFSRLAVWEEQGDSLFTHFIVDGVGNILRAFVDSPATLDFVNADVMRELAFKLMQGGSDTSNPSGIVNPGGTAQTFFGSILPCSISLFSREASFLPDFLFEIADEFSRSVGGMAAGEDFAKYLVTMLDIERVQDQVAVLDAWLAQKTPPPFILEEKWSSHKRAEWNSYRIREDTSRMKMYSAISALVGPTGSKTKEAILRTVGLLSMEIERAGMLGAGSLSLEWNRTRMDEILEFSRGSSPFVLFQGELTGEEIDPALYSYLESIDGFMESDVFHAWRQSALPPLLDCAIEIVLVSDNSREVAEQMTTAATNAVEFLGCNSAISFLTTFQESFQHCSNPVDGSVLMERNFLLPLWKRNAAERLNLLLLGMKDNRLLMDILLERLVLEDTVEGKVRFMSNYATLFITVEKALLLIQSDSQKSKIADALMESWIFSGYGSVPEKPVLEISETVELIKEIFRRIKYGSGILTASEAGEISADMRRKYRDNADSVAIILRWTIDPAREGLLRLLEESQLLLQAAGSDAELMRLLDIHGAKDNFVKDVLPYIEKPSAMKKYLKSLAD